MVDGRILVTGGAGFIGAAFVRACLERTECAVTVLDKLSYAGSLTRLELPRWQGRLSFVRADVRERALVEALLREREVSAVVHFAAETHVDRSIDGPTAFVESNIVGTFELLEALRSYLERAPGRGSFRLLHVSTDEVFGPQPPHERAAESAPYAPRSPYAASKASADHLVRAYEATYGLRAIITHCSNNYGPMQLPEKLVPLMIMSALRARPLPVYGDGGQVRDWLHVEDHVDALLRLLAEGRCGERYNIGANDERTNLAMVNAICDALEQLVPARDNPAMRARGAHAYRALIEHVRDRPGHDRRYALDVSKLRGELRWEPRIALSSGLASTVRWYVEHPEWSDAMLHASGFGQRLGAPRAEEST